MKWWPFPRRLAKPDPFAFAESVNAVHFGENYTETDRYRDFRKVFMDTQEGRRCLYHILDWAHMHHSSVVPGGDSHQTYFLEGERNIGLQILAVLNAEPAEPLEVQLEKEPTNA